MNTAECMYDSGPYSATSVASMEPPCEHGGVVEVAAKHVYQCVLQWSRRVNTAECS